MTTNYTWDDNGNLTARGGDTFSWDYENRLTSATVAGTTTTSTYRADGLRETRQVGGGATTTYTWDLNRGVPMLLTDSNAKYVYGIGMISQKAVAGDYYYLADGLGSTMKTIDTGGNVVNAYTYDVYGKTTSATGSQANDFKFAGEQSDANGLQYLRNRYYDPGTGTFLSRDPLANGPTWSANAFSYAAGNPVNASDPTGLDVEWSSADNKWIDTANGALFNDSNNHWELNGTWWNDAEQSWIPYPESFADGLAGVGDVLLQASDAVTTVAIGTEIATAVAGCAVFGPEACPISIMVGSVVGSAISASTVYFEAAGLGLACGSALFGGDAPDCNQATALGLASDAFNPIKDPIVGLAINWGIDWLYDNGYLTPGAPGGGSQNTGGGGGSW